MLQAAVLRKCLFCEKTLNGRADKKFCNDYCRNAYNNQLKSANNPVIRNINNILIKNRRILDAILGKEEIAKSTKEKLLHQGFNFKYFTELKRVNFNGWISIEDGMEGMDQLKRSVAFLRKKMKQYW